MQKQSSTERGSAYTETSLTRGGVLINKDFFASFLYLCDNTN